MCCERCVTCGLKYIYDIHLYDVRLKQYSLIVCWYLTITVYTNMTVMEISKTWWSKYLCIVCEKSCGVNTIECDWCKRWVHRKCTLVSEEHFDLYSTEALSGAGALSVFHLQQRLSQTMHARLSSDYLINWTLIRVRARNKCMSTT